MRQARREQASLELQQTETQEQPPMQEWRQLKSAL